MIKFLVICLIILTTAYVLVFEVFKPRLTISGKGVALISPATSATFFVPADKPVSVYMFAQNPPQIGQIINQNISPTDAQFGIYLKNLTTNQVYELNGNKPATAASLYKLFVMYTIFKKGSEGKLNINQPDIQQNLAQMIEVSSNEASFYLVNNYTSWDEVNADAQSLGLKQTNLIDPNSEPMTSPENVGKLLELIASGRAVSEDASKQMITFLSKQQHRDRIPALLPNNIFIVNKTGELDDIRNDAGIIGTPENDYILVLMSQGSENPEAIKPVMAKMSLEIYQYFESEWQNPAQIL